jgi:transposase InsO family protein
MGAQSEIFEIIHTSLRQKDTELSVSALCDIAGVSRSGYYRWVSAASVREAREKKDRADFELILAAYNFRGYKKGVLSVHMRLLHTGVVMNPKKIRRLMRKYNLYCPFRKANPYRRMAKALKTSNVAANLLNREFEAHGPRAVLLTDITYMRFHDGFLYLSTILDAYTKEALAHVLSDSLEIDFVLETVMMMKNEYGVSLQAETMIHSDQGCHYTSIQFIQLVKDSGLRQSMSRRGNCWDNAPQESFYGHMKDELKEKMATWETFEDAKRDVDDWFDYYNKDRYQWQLAKLSPSQYYKYVTTGEYPLPSKPDEATSRGSAP